MPGLRINVDASSAKRARDVATRSFQDIGRSAHRTENKVEQANRSINTLDSTVLAMGKSMMTWQAALGAVAGVAGLGYLANQSLAATKQLDKLHEQTGFSTSSIQELEFAATEAGVAQGRLHDALGEMSQRMGEAAADFKRTGGEVTEMGEGFQMAGLAVQGLAQRNPEKVLYQVADAIREAKTESEALAIAVKVFGDEAGRDMVAMLREGSEGLREMAERARDMGMVLGDDIVKESAKAKEQVDMLTDVIGKQFTHAVAELSPVIATAAGHMADLAASFGDMLHTSKQEELNQVQAEITKLEDRIKSLKMVDEEDQGWIEKTFGKSQAEQINETKIKLLELESKEKELKEEIKEFNKALNDNTDSMNDNTTETENAIDISKQVALAYKNEATSVVALAERNRELVNSYQDIALYGKKAVIEAQRTRDMAAGRGIGGAARGADDEWAKRMLTEHAGPISQQGRPWVDQFKDDMDEADSITKQTANSMSNAFDGWANSALNDLNEFVWGADKAFDDVLESFGKMLTKMMLKQSVLEPAAEAFSIGAQSLMSGMFSGPAAPGTAGFNPPAMADGGYASAGGTYLVGEEGPELLHMGRNNGNITPNDQIGGGVDIQIVDQRGSGAPAVETQESQGRDGRRQIRMIIKSEMDGLVRDGSMDKTFKDTFGISRKAI